MKKGRDEEQEDTKTYKKLKDEEKLPPGAWLIGLPNFDEQDEDDLIRDIDSRPWNNSLSRRTQHYGYVYDYSQKDVLTKASEEIPNAWIEKVLRPWNLSTEFNQCIVNEYVPGQGIAKHVDNTKLFAETIVSVSLGSDIVMEFGQWSSAVQQEVVLPRRSALVLTGDARYKWHHAIPRRKEDHGVPRKRRISLTFRQVKQ